MSLCAKQFGGCFAAKHVFSMRDGFEMVRIDTTRQATKMVWFKTNRDWTFHALVNKPMRLIQKTVYPDVAVSMAVTSAKPQPAPRVGLRNYAFFQIGQNP